MWAYIFQVIEEEVIKNYIMYLEGIRRSKRGDQKPSHHPLPLVDPIPDNLRVEDGILMTSWLISWYHRDKEKKKILRGHLEIGFNDH